MISFSSGLLVFVAVLTVVFLVALLFNRRLKGAGWRPKAGIVNYALLGVCGLMILLMVFQYFWGTSVLYFLLYPITVFLLLLALISASASKRFYLLILVVLLHLIVLSLWSPPSGIMLDERTAAIAMLDKTKTWNPNWMLLNPYYNPFPMDLGLSYVFSQITSIIYTDALGGWIVDLFFVIAYDLILFSLVKDISGRWKAGVLSILMLMFTPPLVLNPAPELLAYLLVLVFLLGLFRALKGAPSFSNFMLITLSYTVGILIHAEAAIGAVAVSILLLLMLFGRRLGINIATTAQHRFFVYLVTVSVYVLTIWRWGVLGGITIVETPLISLVNRIINRSAGPVSTLHNYVPLYNQSVSPLIAYAWAVPISLAFAFLLYHVVNHAKRKSLNVVFLLSLSLAGGALVFGGFLGSMLTAVSGLQRYLGYAGLSLLVPVAAVVCAKILRSPSRKIVSLCLIAIVLFSVIAMLDPGLSPQLYPGIQSVTSANSADLIEGNTLYNILSGGKYVVSTYEISTAIGYLSTVSEPLEKTIPFYAGSLKTDRAMIENLTVGKEAQSNIVYIWTPEILQAANDTLLNVVYNSGRYVALESGSP
jgi:hypothetical protein